MTFIKLIFLALVASFALSLLGCAHPTDGLVLGLNESQRVLTATSTILAEQHRRARDQAVELALSADAARVDVLAVHRDYRPKWAAYELARRAWISAAALVSAAVLVDKSGGKPDVAAAQKAVVEVASSLQSFAVQVRQDVRVMP